MKHNVSSATIDLMVAQGYTHVRTLHLSSKRSLFAKRKVGNIHKRLQHVLCRIPQDLTFEFQEWGVRSRIVDLVKAGNRKVAAKLVENALKTMDCGFNALHKEVMNK